MPVFDPTSATITRNERSATDYVDNVSCLIVPCSSISIEKIDRLDTEPACKSLRPARKISMHAFVDRGVDMS